MKRLKPYAILLLVCALIILSRGRIDFTAPQYADWDLQNYRAIAEAAPRIAEDVPPPFPYRLLGPYIVGLLPLPDPLSFRIVTSIACLVLVCLFYQFLLDQGLENATASVTVLLFAFNRYFFGLFVWDPFQLDDVLAMICIVLSFRFMLRRHWLYLALCLTLGALTRETVMVMIPVILLYLCEIRAPSGEFSRAILAVLPAVATFFSVRLLVPADHATLTTPGIFAYYRMKFDESIGNAITPEAWFRRLCWAFLPLTFIPLIFWKRTVRFLSARKYLAVFFLLILVTNLWGIDASGGDAERQMAPSFLPFYWLIGEILRQELTSATWAAPVLLGSASLASLHHLQGIYPLPSKRATLLLTLIASSAASGLALAAMLRESWKRTGQGANLLP